jgi:hypothetical protein
MREPARKHLRDDRDEEGFAIDEPADFNGAHRAPRQGRREFSSYVARRDERAARPRRGDKVGRSESSLDEARRCGSTSLQSGQDRRQGDGR